MASLMSGVQRTTNGSFLRVMGCSQMWRGVEAAAWKIRR
jgi:hypothetical protein